MSEYRVLFLGDIVGKPGRQAVRDRLPKLVNDHRPLFVVVNGENSAGGVGITPSIVDELMGYGVDAITLGNHAFNKREIYDTLRGNRPVVRPANLPNAAPGRGLTCVEKDGIRLAIANLCGRVFMDGYDDPFRCFDLLADQAGTDHLWVDFHAEATSEKIAFSMYADGRATAVVGTHTHVQTADERVSEAGTAAITDVGMCGPWPSVLGMDSRIILRRFLTSMPERFEVADAPGVICGVVVSVQRDSGRATRIERIRCP